MKKVRITSWPSGEMAMFDDFTSNTGSLHLRINPGVVEVKDGNIVLAVYANIPVVARNMDRWKETS